MGHKTTKRVAAKPEADGRFHTEREAFVLLMVKHHRADEATKQLITDRFDEVAYTPITGEEWASAEKELDAE
jgi:hypothetical protein